MAGLLADAFSPAPFLLEFLHRQVGALVGWLDALRIVSFLWRITATQLPLADAGSDTLLLGCRRRSAGAAGRKERPEED